MMRLGKWDVPLRWVKQGNEVRAVTPGDMCPQEVRPLLEVLATFLWLATKRHPLENLERLERGEDVALGQESPFAIRITEGDLVDERDRAEVQEGKERWRALTGTDLGEDFYVVGTSWIRDCIYISRQKLIELLTCSQKLYQQVLTESLPQES
jgi:hypothetical protein